MKLFRPFAAMPREVTMKVLAIANQKGGVGKSTVVHLAWRAQEQGLRTLLVDLDGQANSTHTFVEISEAA